MYYGCTKVRDRNCKCGYINEIDLLKQFEGLMATIDIDEIGIKEKIKEEVTRFKKFQQSLLGKQDKITIDDIDIRNYAKYILREGKNIEKRELLGCLVSKICILDKKIILIS